MYIEWIQWPRITIASPCNTGKTKVSIYTNTLQWRHNEHDGVSNHRRLDCLLNRLFRCRSKKTSKLSITGLCEGNLPVTGGFPSQRASNINVSISWCHLDEWVTCRKNIVWSALQHRYILCLTVPFEHKVLTIMGHSYKYCFYIEM